MRRFQSGRAWCAATAVAFCLVLGAAEVSAQEHADFKELYVAATAKYKAGEFAEARELFLRAYTVRPEPIALLNVAHCFRSEGKPRDALHYYRRFLKTEAPDPVPRQLPEWRAIAVKEVEAIEQELAQAEQEEAQRRTEAAREVASNTTAGTDTSTTSKAPGGLPAEREHVVLDGSDLTTTGSDAPAAGTGAVADGGALGTAGPATAVDGGGTDVAIGATAAPRMSPLRKAAWISFGVGGGALVAAGVCGVLGLSAESDHRDDPTRDSADRVERYETMVNASLVVAGVAAVAGATMYLLSRDDGKPAASGDMAFGVAPTRGGAAAAIGWTF